jgi:hypothetical protein
VQAPLKVPDPELVFPKFPDPLGIVTMTNDKVNMTLKYWKNIAEYVLNIQTLEFNYDTWKELYYPQESKSK